MVPGRRDEGWPLSPAGAKSLTIFVAKDSYKFSAAHWTLFPDGTKEALHGHNYMVGLKLRVRDSSVRNMVDFRIIKRVLKPLCDAWDERIMLPARNPHVAMRVQGAELEVHACGKRYVFPVDETVVIPCENICAEQLAEVFAEAFRERIAAEQPEIFKLLEAYEVTISETAGQGATICVPGEA